MVKKQEALYSDLANLEWAQIAPDKVVIATKDKVWLHSPSFAKNRFARPMTGRGNVATTTKLLNGAIAAAKRVTKSSVKPLSCTTFRWVWQLASAYHLCLVTPEIMEEASIGFAMLGRWNLAEWAAQKANYEEGQDRLVIQEIESLGYSPQAVVKTLVPPSTNLLIDYFIRSVRDWNPIDCVGYSYTMESLAIEFKKEYLNKLKLPSLLAIKADFEPKLHSDISTGIERVEGIVNIVAELAAKERIRVAVACYETAIMCLNSSTKGYTSDKELQRILEPLKLNNKVIHE
jgi:hypothetical protein